MDPNVREQAVEAAMASLVLTGVRPLQNAATCVVDAVAPIICADEAATWTGLLDDVTTTAGSAVDDYRNRLREQVLAKRRAEAQWVTADPDDYNSTLAIGAVDALDAVLALLEDDR